MATAKQVAAESSDHGSTGSPRTELPVRPEPVEGRSKVAVILRSATKPGIQSCGSYQPDRPYQVAPAEAQRLTTAKGFEFVTPGDAEACAAALATKEG